MFSIIDNEIKFKIEILGGNNGDGELQEIPDPKKNKKNDQPSPSGISEEDIRASMRTLGLTEASISKVSQDTINASIEKFTEKTKTEDVSGSVDKPNVDSSNDGENNDTKEVNIKKDTDDDTKVGGNLNEALIKDLKLPLIGGANLILGIDPTHLAIILDALKGQPEVNELYNKIVNETNSSGDWLKDYQSGDLIGQTTGFKKVLNQDFNGNLTIIKDGKEIKLSEYYDMSEKPLTNITDFVSKSKCFTGNLIFDKNGETLEPECLDLIKNSNAWKTSVQEIQGIHPELAVKILQSLNIQGERQTDGTMRVQSYDSWWNGLSKKVKDSLADNGSFVNSDYIRSIIAFVNTNPDIINQMGKHARESDAYGVKPAYHNKKPINYNLDIEGAQSHVTNLLQLLMGRVALLIGEPSYYSTINSGFMLGGAVGPSFIFPATKSNNRIENFPLFSKQIRIAFKNLKSKLNFYNKKLGKTTEDKIEEIFASLEKHEKEAMEAIKQLEYYYLDLQVSKNKSAENVSAKAIEDAKANFKKNLDKINRRSINLLDIAKAYNIAIVDQSSFQPLAMQ